MRAISLISVFSLLVIPASALAKDDTVRTDVYNGGNSATIIQSGAPKDKTVHIEKRPGYTRIEQHSGGNSTTIVQSNGTTPAINGDPQVQRMMRKLMSEQ